MSGILLPRAEPHEFSCNLDPRVALCAAALILLLVRRLTAPGTISECDPEWIANFSLATYRPMLRLLSEDDYKFFTSQPGITPKAVEQFRRERRRVFRSYLRSLVKDFHRLHLAARMTLIYSQQDRPNSRRYCFGSVQYSPGPY